MMEKIYMDKSTIHPSEPTSEQTSLGTQPQFLNPPANLVELLKSVPEQDGKDDLNDKRMEKREYTVRHWVKLITIGILALLGGGIVVSYVLNLLIPMDWRWLSQNDMSSIKDLVTSIVAGLMMSLAIKFFTK